MVKNIKAVIGLNYGDEGKGQVVDYFSNEAALSGDDVLNILTNGSSQRGHTVELPNGRRHVFHHFGSGTFAGADTYFPKQFMVNPIIFNQEYDELSECIKNTKIICNKECPVVTPYHMLIGQARETKERNGSCGQGVWETSEHPLLYVNDVAFFNIKHVIEKLQYVRDTLAKIYNYDLPSIYWSEDLFWSFIVDLSKFINRITWCVDEGRMVLEDYDTVIFENGQGLLLDRKLPDKAHLTPSNTDLTNVKEIIKGIKYKNLETIYVTRSYMTRHGNGPFPTECKKEDINPLMNDQTNIPNEWQGSLRYGHMDWKSAGKRIERFGTTSLAVTHINEYSSDIPDIGVDQLYWSDGLTRNSFNISI